MIKPQRQIEILNSVYEGAQIYDMQAANWLRQTSKLYGKSLVTITDNDDMSEGQPYFYAILTPQGRTYLAMLRRENADNRSSLTSRGI